MWDELDIDLPPITHIDAANDVISKASQLIKMIQQSNAVGPADAFNCALHNGGGPEDYDEKLALDSILEDCSSDAGGRADGIAMATVAIWNAAGALRNGCGIADGWKHVADANLWLGMAAGFAGDFTAEIRRDWATRAAASRHTKNREEKEKVRNWYLNNSRSFKSKDDAAQAATKLFGFEFSTIRDWLKEKKP